MDLQTTMKITAKNQVTFPKKVLDMLGVGKGDRLKLTVQDKQVMVEADEGDILSVAGKYALNLREDEDIDQIVHVAWKDHAKKVSR